MDIYIEPVLPVPRLLVFGVSPTAQALVRMAKILGYTVEAVDAEADIATFPEADRVVTDPDSTHLVRRAKQDPARLFVVVATLGESDVAALRIALSLEPAYVGLVASRKRFAQLRDLLLEAGITGEQLDRVASPAGLDLGAVSPEEISVSVLAEIVQLRRSAPAPFATETARSVDPVCGMEFDTTAGHTEAFGEHTYYFCCVGCRERFLASPKQFVSPSPTATEEGA